MASKPQSTAQESKSNNVTETTPVKSPADPRDYKIFTLSNDLECILVSDAEAEKAACALCVRVGHFADPDSLPGLAHFLEHMLFLGTKKYPNEAEYKQFLEDHGGSSNASTGMHDTCYQFDVGSEHLEEAVDRFAQFFIDPLFTESATDRELNAVNSENSNNQQSDPHRIYQFDKSLALPSHPFHKFGTGNIQTLKENVDKSIDVRKELLAFHDQYYSSSIMKLAIVGKQDLDVLEKLVREKFAAVHNKKNQAPTYSDQVYDKSVNPILYKLVPITERRELKLNWILPSCYQHTLTQPTSLLSYCLGDESPGSVLSYLKELGYATGLSAGVNYNLPEFAIMGCSVYLTPKGLENYSQVVDIVYSYIWKMKQLSDQQWNDYFDERSKVRLMNFNFKGKEKSYGYSRSLAMDLQRNYPRQEFLQCHGGLLFKFDADLIKKYLSYMTVENCYYQIVAKEFEGECKETEKWYGTQYKTEKIDEKVIQQWKECSDGGKKNEKLFTPLANKYIADDFTILCDAEKDPKQEQKSGDTDDKVLPYVIRETEESKIWFKQDTTFKKPKLGVNVRLYSPYFNDETLSMSLTDLVMLILNDELSDSTYAFEEAAMSFSASFNGSNGISFGFYGYNQKLHLLMETVFEKFQNLTISKEKYEINLEKYKRIIVSMRKSQPYSHCDMIDTLFLCPKSVSLTDLEEAYEKITYEGVVKQYQRIFEKLYIESLIFGNIDSKNTIQPYYSLIDKYLVKSIKNKYPLSELEADKQGCLKLEPNKNYCVAFKCPNEEDKNSCISSTYLYKVDNVRDFAPMNLFAHLCNAPCFDQLRTKEQLGYIVWSFNDMVKAAFKCPNEEDKNSGIAVSYLYKVDTVRDFAVLDLFAHLCDAPCFDQLRTKEQLGYIVWSFNDMVKGFMTFRILIQSNCANPKKLNCRIEEFLKTFRDVVEKMDDDTFALNKKSVINNLLEKPKTIHEQNSRYWREITSSRYQFQRRENLAKEIEKVSKEDVLKFYDEFIVQNSEARTKFTVHCYGNQHPMEVNQEADADKESCYEDEKVVNWNISDVADVRQKCGYYPFPYNDSSKL
eukprot:CAMPEP_0197074844 /NCGR_PEP_ID=MMETSP1384-20130603/211309_1 /TAXON_ID=29189 /ORGANISM="Ammonia sp." /LENGTH=1070 /DNA_ID=CAMNT_0042513685 /DNA_START=164 /DNA_END=3375 /DNA_ORIENTATION=+